MKCDFDDHNCNYDGTAVCYARATSPFKYGYIRYLPVCKYHAKWHYNGWNFELLSFEEFNVRMIHES